MVGQHSTNTFGRLPTPDLQGFGSSPKSWIENVQRTRTVPATEELVVSNSAHSKILFLMKTCHSELSFAILDLANKCSPCVYSYLCPTVLSHIKILWHVLRKQDPEIINQFPASIKVHFYKSTQAHRWHTCVHIGTPPKQLSGLSRNRF